MRDAAVTLPFADDEYRFRLGIGELEILQEEIDVGPYVLADRLRQRRRAVRFVDDVVIDGVIGPAVVSLDGEINPPLFLPPQCGLKEISAVIRIGLVGGGKPQNEARRMVKSYVDPYPPEEHRILAWTILSAALYGAPEEQVGEQGAPDLQSENSSPTSQTES